MKIAYRIVTPIIAVASIVLGIFLKMFYFVIGSENEQIGSIVNLVSQLSNGKISTTYEFSVFEMLKMLATASPKTEDAKSLQEIAAPIIPGIIAFFVFFAIAALVCVAIAAISAALNDSKKKRHTVIGLSAVGIVILFICIIISNSVFTKIMNGDVSISELVGLFSDNAIATLATAILTITEATLSAGFYAMFGIFMFIIIWTIFAGMLIKTPIQKSKKSYKRKKPMKKLSAIFSK